MLDLMPLLIDLLLTQRASQRTIKFEGYRSCPYTEVYDKTQYAIGYGRQVSKDEPCTTKEKEYAFVVTTIYDHHQLLKERVRGYKDMPDKVKMVLLDMLYNMGEPRMFKFVKTLKAIQDGNYNQAAEYLLQSRYARQVKTRALHNATLLREAANAIQTTK